MSSATRTPALRPATDRFLIGILIGIGLLLVAATISIAIVRQPARELPADSPGGTIQRFFVALDKGAYNTAYDFLSDSISNKPGRQQWIGYVTNMRAYQQSDRVEIFKEEIKGEQATVQVRITRYYNDGFPLSQGSYSEEQTIGLRLEATGWKITGLPYSYMPPDAAYPYKGY